jgi:hypothetical protein
MDVSLLLFTALKINTYIYKNVCILYRNVYTLYIQYIYTLQICTSAKGTAIHHIAWSSQSTNPRKYTVLNWNCVFDLGDVSQEHNPGVKSDLPVL